MQDKKNYMNTYTGKKINPLSPDISDITIEDIAHALSLLCRGNGQTKHFYSVGQHCINCAKEAKARKESTLIQLACLLHDAAEAYLNDVIRPVKIHLPLYYEIEERFLNAVYQKFGLDTLTEEQHSIVKEIDNILLTYDLVVLLNEPLPDEGYLFRRVPDVEFRPFDEVEKEYLSLFHSLMSDLQKSQ